jgi:hypothetical protein
LEVLAADGPGIEELVFLNVTLNLQTTPEEPFAACALALNLRTNVVELPRANRVLRATCYPQFGLVGARVAVIGCPQSDLRAVLQEAVSAAPELPHSRLGGPWALDEPINRGSYLFNFDGVTEKNVDRWIELARSLGMTQIDFHGGHSFRFGDLQPHPELYPQGLQSMQATIDRLHASGIAAGLHTYAFFIAKSCPWVTPVADARLASKAAFTLSSGISPTDTQLPVVESTEKVSTITGFFVRNSVTLRIDEELIVFSEVSSAPPFSFRNCQRGALGTRPASHAAGAKVHHLKECFGLFAPDADSTLFTEIAARTAEVFNTCGFDMIYLDALDGSDVLDPYAGGQFAWHYGARFAYEIVQRLRRPALMEMSTFHHHLWCVRSRYCAWDHPNRSYKRFVDIHCADNENSRRMFLPGELGWWALKSWTGPQVETTYADDIEYLMGKCLATDTGFALMGIDPTNAETTPALRPLGALIKRYEDLRHSQQVPDSIKQRLRVPGDEFVLTGDVQTGWRFSPANYDQHRVEEIGGPTSSWFVLNRHQPQPLHVRIAALMAAGSYDLPDNPVLADFQSPDDFRSNTAQSQVTAQLASARDVVKVGDASGRFTAISQHATPTAAWACIEKPFAPVIDLNARQALGLWVHGDGQGELLNVQLRSPEHVTGAISDHYIPIDFQGWRYFELIEPEGARYADYRWPYGNIYSIYRESIQFSQVATLGLWYNNLPVGKEVCCYLSPIKALPLTATRLINPSLTIAGQTLVFPVEIESGSYLEMNSLSDCKLYGPAGQLLREVVPTGDVPLLASGDNRVTFACDPSGGQRARAAVTVITQGQPLEA